MQVCFCALRSPAYDTFIPVACLGIDAETADKTVEERRGALSHTRKNILLDKKHTSPFVSAWAKELEIKNMATKRSRAAMKLNGRFRLITTGTPLENNLGELWNLFRFINPGLLGSIGQFNKRFASPIEKDKRRDVQNRLKNIISPFILRRLKSQVLDELPPRTEINLHVTLSEEEASFYEVLRRRALTALEQSSTEPGNKQIRILAEIMRLRRACCNPSLIEPNIKIQSSKLTVFEEIITELMANNNKVLVLMFFKSSTWTLKRTI